LESDEGHFFMSIHFRDATHGCAVGSSVLLYCTNDGGRNWTSKRTLPKAESGTLFPENLFTKIIFASAKRGWVLAEGGFLFQTDDAGRTWHELDLFKPMEWK